MTVEAARAIVVSAVRALAEQLRGVNAEWTIAGSTASMLRGGAVTPKDIDILTNRDGAYEIQTALATHVVERVRARPSDKLHSHFGIAVLHGVRVEIIGDLHVLTSLGEWAPISPLESTPLLWDGVLVPVLSSDGLCRFYERLRRLE